MLVYPATMPSAKSPGTYDSPTIITAAKPQPGPYPSGSGDGDGGDGDDLAGLRDTGTKPTGTGGVGLVTFGDSGSAAKVWWMYLLFIRLF